MSTQAQPVTSYLLIESLASDDFAAQIDAVVANGGKLVGGVSIGYKEGRPVSYSQMVSGVTKPAPPPTLTVPDAPADVVAVDLGGGRVQIDWTAPANDGGSPITEYGVTGSNTGMRMQGITGVTMQTPASPEVPQTWTVAAMNDTGWSAESAPSNSVTPAPEDPALLSKRGRK